MSGVAGGAGGGGVLPGWTASYRGFDDAVLTAAASAGLVRRARGLLTSAPPAWVSTDASSGVVEAHKQRVRLDAAGPATARCPCPAVGVCVHVVLACLFVHEAVVAGAGDDGAADDASGDEGGAGDGAPAVRDAAPHETEPSAARGASAEGLVRDKTQERSEPIVLTELADLTPDRAVRAAGVVAARAVAARHGALTPELRGAAVVVDAHRAVVTWEAATIVIVAGAGWAGIVVPTGVSLQKAAQLRLEGVARARIAVGLGWEWPTGLVADAPGGPLTDDDRAFLADVRALLTGALTTGVARLDGAVPMRVEAAVTTARAHQLPELARALARVSESMRRVLTGSDVVSDAEVVGTIAQAWAFTRALEATTGEALTRLRGRPRTVRETEQVQVHPVGAWTWSAASGARGATVAFVTAEGAAIHESVAGRARLQDPTFRAESASIWGVPVAHLLGRSWTLVDARLGDGEVSASDRTTALPGGAPDEGRLAAAGVSRWSDLPPREAPQLVGGRSELALLTPAGAGELRLDELDQELVWPLVDADGEVLEVRLGVLGRGGTPADNLTRLAESVRSAGLRLRHVLVRRGPGGLVPLSAAVHRSGGALEIRSFTLGWPEPPRRSGLGGLRALRAALAALRARVERRSDEVRETTSSAVAMLLERVQEVCVDVAVSGRRVLGDADRERVRDLARRCGDAGLGLVARALERWAGEGTGAGEPEAMLRVLLLAERALVVVPE